MDVAWPNRDELDYGIRESNIIDRTDSPSQPPEKASSASRANCPP